MLNCRSKSLVKSLLMVGCSVFLLSSSKFVRLKNLMSSSPLHGHGHDLHAIIPVFVGANGHPKEKKTKHLHLIDAQWILLPLCLWLYGRKNVGYLGGFMSLVACEWKVLAKSLNACLRSKMPMQLNVLVWFCSCWNLSECSVDERMLMQF
jgi:hypothetical protein